MEVRPAQRHLVDASLHPAAVGFVFDWIGFVFDFVKSPIDTSFRSNLNNLLTLCLEHVYPKLASFGAIRGPRNCQTPPSRSGFSLTIYRPRPSRWTHLRRAKSDNGRSPRADEIKEHPL
jgi:hypothetical protein